MDKKAFRKKKNNQALDLELDSLDEEIEYYERKLKLKGKHKDKNYKKIYDYLERDGFGRDLYDFLDSKISFSDAEEHSETEMNRPQKKRKTKESFANDQDKMNETYDSEFHDLTTSKKHKNSERKNTEEQDCLQTDKESKKRKRKSKKNTEFQPEAGENTQTDFHAMAEEVMETNPEYDDEEVPLLVEDLPIKRPKKSKKKKKKVKSEQEDLSNPIDTSNSDRATKEPKSVQIGIERSETTKKLTSILNKLSDQNIEPLTRQLVDLYHSESNNTLNESLWSFLSSVLSKEYMPQQLLAAYAATLIGASKSIGREILAFILFKLYNERSLINKSYASFWAYFYLFGAIRSTVMIGLLSHLIDQMSELSVTCLLLVFNTVGFKIRKDEPSAIKELFSNVSQVPEKTGRLDFLVTRLEDIKNNKKKANAIDGSLSFLKSWLKKTVKIKDFTLPVDWKDLKNKKWRELLEPTVKTMTKNIPSEIEELAAQQHMNSSSRKSIFCSLITSEDYMDAFAKMQKFKKSEKDVVRVLITACGQENYYNEFYSLVSIQLCKHKSSYIYSFQYALWDSIKQFQEFSIRKVVNIAKMFGKMIGEQSVPISILKFIDFHDMNEQVSVFLRILVGDLIGNYDEKRLVAVFQHSAEVLRDNLRLYIKVTLLQNRNQSLLNKLGEAVYTHKTNSIIKALNQE